MRFLPLAAALVLVAGCGTSGTPRSEPVPFTGTVTLPDGKPAKDVTAVFVPKSADQTAGRYAVNGKGELTPSAGGKITLIPGEYTVRFEPVDARTRAEEARYRVAFEAIPSKFREGQPDGFPVTVKGGEQLAIQLQK